MLIYLLSEKSINNSNENLERCDVILIFSIEEYLEAVHNKES